MRVDHGPSRNWAWPAIGAPAAGCTSSAPEADAGVAAILGEGDGGPVRFVRRRSPLVSVELVAALRRGEVVAFQMDRALGGRGDVRVPFFGAPAPFPSGPFLIAAAAGAPVIPAFCVLEPTGAYRVHVEPAFEVKRGEEALARAVSVSAVRAHWDQWFNFDVWDGRPVATEPIAITGAGVVTAVGQDLDSFWAALVTGVSGITEIERFPVADLRVTRGGEVKKPLRPLGPARGRGACRASQFLIHAAREALEAAGLAGSRPEPAGGRGHRHRARRDRRHGRAVGVRPGGAGRLISTARPGLARWLGPRVPC
jgi:hypothetical protein